jgi:hypothetical protein
MMFTAVVPFGSLAAQGHKKLLAEKCLVCSSHPSSSVYHSGLLGGVVRCLATATTSSRVGTQSQDVNGGPLGSAAGRSNNGHHLAAKHRRQVPWGCCRWVQQWAPLGCKISMGAPRGCCWWVRYRPTLSCGRL